MAEKERVGFIGLGVMGQPMSGHLAAAGWPMCVHDVDPAAAQRVLSEHPNVVAAGTPAEVATQSDIVITMLPDGEAVHAAVFGDHGLSTSLRPGSLVLDTSSSQPWLTMLKDIGIASTLARNHDVSMPLIALGEQVYQAAADNADPRSSVSEIGRWVEQRMGTEIR